MRNFLYFIICTSFCACKQDVLLKQPESAVATEEFIYVSNVNGSPDVKDGNGYISKLYKNGKACENEFISHLNAPKGMCLVGNTLFVTDLDVVYGFNILTKKQEYFFDFKPFNTSFLNDICFDGNSNLFVSSTDQHEVYTINIKSGKMHALGLKDSLNGTNGLCCHDSILYIVEMGSDTSLGGIAQVSFRNNSIQFDRLYAQLGILDGLFYLDHKLYISDWATEKNMTIAQIHIFDLHTKTITSFPLDKQYNGIADIDYDSFHHRILAPIMEENKLQFFQIP